MKRRDFLNAALTGSVALVCRSHSVARQIRAADARIEILLEEPIGKIAPEIYGHFAEHLGGVIYDGIWVGENSKIPNIGGIRKALVDAMLRIKPPVVRWPGGCFADSYNWRDGIGPRNQRPRRTNFWVDAWEWPKDAPDGPWKYDTNQFGVDDFLRFCQLINAQPYLAANLRSLTARDFYEWVEYCNSPAGSTTLAEMRSAAGQREPYQVRYWGVGNESWGCGGNFTPEEYAAEYRRFSEWVPIAHANDGGGSIRIPACQCGVFGLKPTRGREIGNRGSRGDRFDALNIASELCVSRSVRDTAAFLNAVEKKDNSALQPVGFVSEPSKKKLKIALLLDSFQGKRPHPEVEKGVKSSAKLCEKLGHKIEEVKLPINGEEFIDAFLGLWASGTVELETLIAQLLGKEVKREDVLEPWTIGLIEMAKSRGVESCVQRAIRVFGEVTASVENLFKTYDVILSPVMRTPPYKIGWHAPTVDFKTLLDRVLDEVGYTPLHNAAGTPAMSAPLHWTPDGLPVGIQFAAWRGGDAMLLQLAYELEAAQPWAKKRPPVFAG